MCEMGEPRVHDGAGRGASRADEGTSAALRVGAKGEAVRGMAQDVIPIHEVGQDVPIEASKPDYFEKQKT